MRTTVFRFCFHRDTGKTGPAAGRDQTLSAPWRGMDAPAPAVAPHPPRLRAPLVSRHSGPLRPSFGSSSPRARAALERATERQVSESSPSARTSRSAALSCAPRAVASLGALAFAVRLPAGGSGEPLQHPLRFCLAAAWSGRPGDTRLRPGRCGRRGRHPPPPGGTRPRACGRGRPAPASRRAARRFVSLPAVIAFSRRARGAGAVRAAPPVLPLRLCIALPPTPAPNPRTRPCAGPPQTAPNSMQDIPLLSMEYFPKISCEFRAGPQGRFRASGATFGSARRGKRSLMASTARARGWPPACRSIADAAELRDDASRDARPGASRERPSTGGGGSGSSGASAKAWARTQAQVRGRARLLR